MKKFFIIITIFFILLIICTFNTNTFKIIRANIMYGKKTCCTVENGTTDVTTRTCHICLKHFEGSSSVKLCSECAKLTNRCRVCGHINDENGRSEYLEALVH